MRQDVRQSQSTVDTADQVSLGSVHSDVSGNSIKYNGGPKRSSTGGYNMNNNGGQHQVDRRSLDGARHNINNNGSMKYYSMPGKDSMVTSSNTSLTKSSSGRYSNVVTTAPPPPGYGHSQSSISKQRSLEGDNFKLLQSPYAQSQPQDGSLSRSISFMARNEQNGERGQDAASNGRRSIEATPQSGRRYPLHSPEYSDHPAMRPGHRSHGPGHSRTSSISSMGGHGTVDGFPTPMTNRRTGAGYEAVIGRHGTSESEDSGQSPAKERRGVVHGHSHVNGAHHGSHPRPKTLMSDLVDSGLSTLTEPDNHR